MGHVAAVSKHFGLFKYSAENIGLILQQEIFNCSNILVVVPVDL